jgi:hypothetical protein
MNVSIANPIISPAAATRLLPIAATFVLLFAIALLPIVSTAVPVLSDYPNHLARMHILQQDGMSQALNTFYLIDWELMPNLAMDILVPTLADVVGIYNGGRGFLALTLLLLASGTLALHHALFRRASIWPLTAMLLLYNQIFLYGVVNFLFGLGLALWGIAAWIRLTEKPRWWHALAFAVFSTLIWVSHLSAFGVFALMLGTLLAGRWSEAQVRHRLIGLFAATFALPVFLTIAGSIKIPLTSPETVNGTISISYYLTKPLLLLTTFQASGHFLDFVLAALVALLLFLGFKSNYLQIDPRMKRPLAVMTLAFLAMPPLLMASALADYRIMIAAQFLLLAAIDIKPGSPAKLAWSLFLPVFAIYSLRVFAIAEQWRSSDQVAQAALAAFEHVEYGSRLFPAVRRESGGQTFRGNYENFLPTLAVIARSAFVPSLYALPGAQPVKFTPPYERLRSSTPQRRTETGMEPDWPHVLANYDYVWVPAREHFATIPSDQLQLVASHPRFRLFKVIARE